MKQVKRWVLRVAAGTVLVLALAAPSPGNVGACGAGITVADPVEHCTEREYRLCRRDQFAQRISENQFNACVEEIEDSCSGAAWPGGCTPTPDQSQACLTLLLRADLIDLTNQQLLSMNDDCNLCGGR